MLGKGGSGSGSGFAVGIAHVHGFTIGNFLSRYSRREGVHIEDGCKFGITANYVLRNCQWHGWVGGPGGYGNNQDQSLPLINTTFSYEFSGATGQGATALYNVWDAKGSADYWMHLGGYAKGFDRGVTVCGGDGIAIVDNVMFDGVTTLIQAAGSSRQLGTIYSRGATNIVSVEGDLHRIHVDTIIAPRDVPAGGKIFTFPSVQNIGRASIKRFEVKASGVGTICAASGYTNVVLMTLPRRFLGDIIIRSAIGGTHPIGFFSRVKWNGSAVTTGDSVSDTDESCALASISAVSGALVVGIYNGATYTRTVTAMTVEFDGMWIE